MIRSNVKKQYIEIISLNLLTDEPSYSYEIPRKISDCSQGLYTMKETIKKENYKGV